MLKQSIIENLFTDKLLLPLLMQLHQVYGKLLNYIKIDKMFTCQRWYHLNMVLYVGEGSTVGGTAHPYGAWEGTMLTKMRMCVSPIWCGRGSGGWAHCRRGFLVLDYLRCSEGMPCNNLSHMWSNWYFPRFLLRDWSLTWMYIASFMFLVTPCDSLSAMVEHSKFTGCPVVWLC